MRSSVTTSAAVPPLACVGRNGKPKTSFLRMLGTVLGWVLLLLLLLYCEAAIVVAYGTAVEMRIRLKMGLPHYEMGEKSLGSDAITTTSGHGHPTLAGSKNISVISGLTH